ncbi:MAG: monofunctional biosynthetic peptidoglycan transglycosylase, partial [Deltaproteobacteria bacterium]|nr:monofunctional biosynthetic peptidoglycan transglycosylase [Deltaproteobacteria bacterium]
KIILVLVALPFLYLGFYLFYPPVAKLKKENPRKTSFMEYREQEWRREGKNVRLRQQWVPLSRISPYLIKAVAIAEDDKFYKHEGFDFKAIQKAVERNIQAGKFKVGGSTISQQLAKNLYLTSSKNPVRKIKETILTWRLERALSKKRIMELYLNVVEWGEGVFGAEMAARTWYGKPASALGPEEAARLAVVLPNPRKYNPRSSSRYVANRSQIIYNIMVRRGIVIPVYEEIMAPASPEIPSGPTPAPAAPEPEGPAGEGTQPHPEVTP